MTLLIGDNMVVSMHYKLTDNDGNLLDSSEGKDPLDYLHGAGNIIPGLEKELTGKSQGDSLQVTIAPEQAYGPVVPELVQTIEKSVFQDVDPLEVGMVFEAQAPNGAMQRIMIKEIEGDKVTVDANHPLAGVTLNFDVDIVEVRQASDDEINQGHI